VSQGGHSVPEDAIVARYDRALKSLPEAAKLADQLLVVDNSVRLHRHRLIARFAYGKLVTLRNNVPPWAERVFATEFKQFRAARCPR
jgi:predicted ABC-type ATPase